MILAFQQIFPPAFCLVFSKQEKKILVQNSWNPQKTRDLLSKLAASLKKGKIKPSQLKGIFFINGPGNFTPVRISCVIANTLAKNLFIPIFSLSSDDLKKFSTKEKTNPEFLVKMFFNKKVIKNNFTEAIFGNEKIIN